MTRPNGGMRVPRGGEFRPKSRQQGVYAVMFVLLLSTIIGVVVMLGMEVNRLYSEHRALQNQANAAAIAAANAAHACGSMGDTLSADALVRNAIYGPVGDGGVRPGEQGSRVSVGLAQLGYLATESGIYVFHAKDDIDETNAAHVVLKREAQLTRFLPGWLGNNAFQMSAEATARKEVIATISAAGKTVQVGKDGQSVGLLDGLLGGLFGKDDFKLDATNASSLADTLVSLGDLLDILGVSTVVQLLDKPVTDLVEGLLTGVHGVTKPLVDNLDGLLGGLKVSTLKLGDVLDVVGDVEAAKGANFRLYDLLTTLVLDLVHETTQQADSLLRVPVQIHNLDLGVAKADVDLQIRVGEPPKIAIGPARWDGDARDWVTRFQSPDVTVQLVTSVNLGPQISTEGMDEGLRDFVDATSINVLLRLPLTVTAGGGEGWLTQSVCANGLSNEVRFRVDAEPKVAQIKTSMLDDHGDEAGAYVSVRLGPLNALLQILRGTVEFVGNLFECIFTGKCQNLVDMFDDVRVEDVFNNNYVKVIGADLDIDVEAAGSCQALDFNANLHTGEAEPPTRTCGDGLGGIDIRIGSLTVLDNNLRKDLKIIFDPLESILNGLLDGLVESVGTLVLNPLLAGLGVQLSGMDVSVVGAQQPTVTLVPGKIEVVH